MIRTAYATNERMDEMATRQANAGNGKARCSESIAVSRPLRSLVGKM